MTTNKKKLTVDGITLAYEDYGEGAPVVFIHGFPTSTYSWSRVARPLSAYYRTVSFDLMGFGDSDKPLGESYSIERQAELISGAIRELQLVRPILVGHSMGGGMCLTIASKNIGNPDAIAGLALADPACYPQKLPWFFQALKVPIVPAMLLRRIPPRLAYLMVRGTAYHPKSKMKLEDMLGYILNVQKEGAAEAFVATALEIVPKDMDALVSSYPKISIPTLLIWGKQDGVIPLKHGHRLAAEIGTNHFHIIENCRHTPQEEHPEQVSRILKQFVDEATRDGANG